MTFPGSSMTVLRLSGIGVPPYSARGLTQTLVPISASQQMRRTINGALRDFSGPQFRKYVSAISGDDQQPPACDGVWPGRLVTVECITELAVQGDLPTEGLSNTEMAGLLGRPPVSGSVRSESGFIFYRPALVMRVVSLNVTRREWEASVPWTMELEEV